MAADAAGLQAYFTRRARLYERVHGGRAGTLEARWWQPLLTYRARTLEALARPEGLRILEVGCGTGHLAADLARRGASVHGLDFTPEMVEAAGRCARAAGVAERLRFERADFDTWDPPPDAAYDCTIALAVFEYCADLDRWLARLANLAPELIATFALSSSLHQGLRRTLSKVRRGHTLRLYARQDVDRSLAAAGFTVRESSGYGTTLWLRATRP